MSRGALVTDRRQSAHDKTRVSSINKRRVTPVPRSARRCRRDRNLGARPERELPSRCRTPRRSWVAATRASRSARTPGGGASPLHSPAREMGMCPLGHRLLDWTAIQSRLRRGLDDPPILEAPHVVGPDGPHPSEPVPTPGLPSVAIHRLIADGERPAASNAAIPPLTHPDFSRTNDATSGTPHDDAFPDDLALPDTRACALAISWRTSTTLARGLGCSASRGRPFGSSGRMNRVAFGRSRAPAFPSPSRPRRTP